MGGLIHYPSRIGKSPPPTPSAHVVYFDRRFKLDVDLVLESANTLPKNTNNCNLDLQDSVIWEVEPMAKLLSIVAPNIECIQSWEDAMLGDVSEDSAQEYQDRWREVMVRIQESRLSEESVD